MGAQEKPIDLGRSVLVLVGGLDYGCGRRSLILTICGYVASNDYKTTYQNCRNVSYNVYIVKVHLL